MEFLVSTEGQARWVAHPVGPGKKLSTLKRLRVKVKAITSTMYPEKST
jgi:hypothetical protein